jgi:hypothetical protein
MALPSWDALLLLIPFPVIVWGADELLRAHRRSRQFASAAPELLSSGDECDRGGSKQ